MFKRFITTAIFFVLICTNLYGDNNYGEIININYEYEIAFTDLSDNYLKVKDIVEIRKDGKFVTYLQVSQTSPAISRLIPIKDDSKYRTEIDFKNITVGSTVINISPDAPDSLPFEKIGQNNFKKVLLEDSRDKDMVSAASDGTQKDENIESLNDKVNILSDNYVRLSKSLSDLLEQKKQIETELFKNKDELESLISKNESLESDNDALKKELTEYKNKMNEDKCGDLKNEVIKLKSKMNFLKSKLINMNELIDK